MNGAGHYVLSATCSEDEGIGGKGVDAVRLVVIAAYGREASKFYQRRDALTADGRRLVTV